MSIEFFVCVSCAFVYKRDDILLFPLQNLGILAAPFIVPSQYTLPVFLYNIDAKYLSHIFWAVLTYESKSDFLVVSNSIGILHLAALYFILLIQYPTIKAQSLQQDPLFPYAISKEILHSKVLDRAPQSTAGTTEGGEGGAGLGLGLAAASTASACSAGSSRRRGRNHRRKVVS
jgi:hypothetical protein